MDIVIKNVTGDPSNDGCIFELSCVGFPAGSVIRDVQFNRKNKACYWSSGSDECIAWLGQTCIKKPKITNIGIFSPRGGGLAVCAFVDGKKVEPVKVSREDTNSYVSSPANARKLAEKYLIP